MHNLFFKNLLKKATIKNLKDIEKNINNKEYKHKICNWSKKFGFDCAEILEKAKKDLYFRAFFIKEPLKQNIIEKAVAKKISQIDNVFDFRKLNNHGKNSLYLDSGEITNVSKINKPTKTIDFAWTIKNNKNTLSLNCYAYHKYINEPGGAQDNQFNDIKSAIKNAPQKTNPCIFFICDGDYFTKQKKMELQKLKKTSNCIITTTHTLEKEIKKLVYF